MHHCAIVQAVLLLRLENSSRLLLGLYICIGRKVFHGKESACTNKADLREFCEFSDKVMAVWRRFDGAPG
jgi:hypothetical protein